MRAYLHPSLYEAGGQAGQQSDVGSVAGLAHALLQLVQKHQLISIHRCLQSLKHTITDSVTTTGKVQGPPSEL